MSEPTPSRSPIQRADLTGTGRDHRPIVILNGDPAIERVHLIGRTTLSVLTAALVAALGLSIISVAGTPIGWIVTALAAALGLVAPWTWQQLRRRDVTRLAVWQLAPRWAEPVSRAAGRAERLRQLAERSPEGPVAEHFERLAVTAEGYVIALHEAAIAADASTGGDPAVGDPELERDMRRIIGGLGELVEAAERLRDAQRRHLESSPLAELTAETDRLTAAIEADVAQVTDSIER